MISLAPDLALLRYPLRFVGLTLGRTVTVIRLDSGKVVIHSTGPFTPEDLKDIKAFGDPSWLVEATCFHDTFSTVGTRALGELPYFVPAGFEKVYSGETHSLSKPPEEWENQLDVIPIRGMRFVNEHAFYHRNSRTLIVADLLFNLTSKPSSPIESVFRRTAGLAPPPAMSRLFRSMIKEKEAFASSIQEISALEFTRIVVAHGEVLETQAKERFVQLMQKLSYL